MVRNRPVKICTTRHNPRSDPKFHKVDKLTGAGRSISDPLITLIRGCVCRRGLNIFYCNKFQCETFLALQATV